MEKKSLMPSSLVILAVFLCIQVCCCVRPGTKGHDMEAAASQNRKCVELQEEERKLNEPKKKSSSSCNETSLEGRPLVDGASQLGTNDQSLSGERDSSRDWDPHLDQNVQGRGLYLQRSNVESTCLDGHAGNRPGYSMDGTQKTAVEANDNSFVTAKCSPSHFEQENKNEVEVRRNYPSSPLHSVKTFEELPLSEQLHHGVYDMGFKKPSKIQGTVLPELLADPENNLIMISLPGAGKTTASVLSMLSRVDATQNFTQVIFLSPTDELALQTRQVTEKMSKFCPEIKIGYAVGGRVSPGHKVTDHIVFGTPGTMLDWISRYKVVDPRKIKMFVVDAADAMIEIQGHHDHCIRIYKKLPADCQIVLCSDTYDDELMNFANRVVLHPKVICLNLNEEIHDNVKQVYVVCRDQTEKQQALSNMYGLVTIGQCIVFCGTRNSALCLAFEMTAEGHSVALLYDGMTLEQRLAVLNRFRDGKDKLLITSNVCPRGIDVEQVTAVVNYDMPVEPTEYLHRICRTGWLGRNCIAVNLIDGFSWSMNIMKKIEEHFGWKISLLETNDVEKLEKGNEDLKTGLFAFGFVVFQSKK